MILPAAYAVLETIAILKKGDSVYDNAPEEKNPLQGQMVKFIEDENEPENADGVKGHLISVGKSNPETTIYDKSIKRGIDKALSFAGLVVLAPIYAGISLAIIIDDPGPVLFTQKRVGKDKEFFKLHKFRSMKMSTPHDVPTHMLENPEQYITRVGKILRKLSLDELPQIWDIFLGNMSIIGPRPALWNQDLLISERDKYGVNNYKPGLTGLAQINGRDELSIIEKSKIDYEYIKSLNLLNDVKIFMGSLNVFTGDNSVVEGSAKVKNSSMALVENDNSEHFSVLMSVYSKEKASYFDLSLNSILESQTRKPDELILVCDGPLTDELDAVIEDYKTKYPTVLSVYRIEQNQGLGRALNYGLQKCSYDIVLRADSDDICANNRFDVQVKFMEQHPDIAVCSSYIDEFDMDWTQPHNKKELPLKSDDLYKMAKFRNPINHMAAAFRKHVILEIGSYKHIPYVEDYELWVRTLVNGYKIANIDQVLVHARVGNGMVKRRGNKIYINSWLQLNRYMLSNKMINRIQFVRNMIAISVFVYMPDQTKEIIYKGLLRK